MAIFDQAIRRAMDVWGSLIPELGSNPLSFGGGGSNPLSFGEGTPNPLSFGEALGGRTGYGVPPSAYAPFGFGRTPVDDSINYGLGRAVADKADKAAALSAARATRPSYPLNPSLSPDAIQAQALYSPHVSRLAGQYGVDEALVRAVIEAESSWNAAARSPVGAVGLMQLMPDTAAGLGVDPYNAVSNIEGGTRYLAQQLAAFGGDVPKALAAYNAGPGTVTGGGTLPAETQAYVRRVMGLYNRYRDLASPAASAASEASAAAGAGLDYSTGGVTDSGANARAVVSRARGLMALSLPYVFGGGRNGDRSSVDCSSYVSRVFDEALHVKLPAQTDEMFRATAPLIRVQNGQQTQDAPRPGDLVFFRYNSPMDASEFPHVGIVVSGGARPKMMNAVAPGIGIREDDITDFADRLGASVVYRRVYKPR